MTQLEYDGDAFSFIAHPHEEGGGFSYTIQMSNTPGDSIHCDTKRGTVLSDDEICALRAYFKIVRERDVVVFYKDPTVSPFPHTNDPTPD